MMCRLMRPFSLMYGSHDMRHTGFPQVDSGQRDPREMGRHKQARHMAELQSRANHLQQENDRLRAHLEGE